jgi:hypothetical protein
MKRGRPDPPPWAPKFTYQKHEDTLHGFMAMILGAIPDMSVTQTTSAA